jgi:hypothetical protein
LKGYKRLSIVFFCIAAIIILLAQCIESKKEPATATTIAGAATCRQCHAAIVDLYLENPHQQTSHGVESKEDLKLDPEVYAAVHEFNKHSKVVIEDRSDGVYQVGFDDGVEKVAKRIDVIIGSGEKAYTYGSWEGSKLKQLPLSYYKVLHSWANSPGFPSDKMYFDRPVTQRCLECHSSFAERKTVLDGPLKVAEEFNKNSLVYGIDCERCHGPAGKHVEFQLDHPLEKTAKYIAVYKILTRQQKVDACAVCHAGNDVEIRKSTFAFKPGDDLRNYYSRASAAKKEADVHGNQSRLLADSKCFINSKTMDCATCHSTHENVKGNLTLYSKKCMSCHESIKHSPATLSNAMVKSNCIDCHMPKQASSLISFQVAGAAAVSPYLLRTHKIGVFK